MAPTQPSRAQPKPVSSSSAVLAFLTVQQLIGQFFASAYKFGSKLVQIAKTYSIRGQRKLSESEPTPKVTRERLLSYPTNEIPSVFVDLDGTLLRTEMGHTIVKFVRGLPNPYQRAWKTFLIPFVGITTKLASFFSESLAVHILAMAAIRSVSIRDVAISAEKAIMPALHAAVRPAILEEIRKHQREGRHVVILTGNFEPLVKPFCDSIGCACVGTVPEADPTQTFFTGRLQYRPNVSTEKVRHVESSGRDLNELFGYGNTLNDIPFLAKTGNPHIVSPDRKLSRHASIHGWEDKFSTTA